MVPTLSLTATLSRCFADMNRYVSLDEESGSLSSFGMMSSPIRIDAHPMMGAGHMKPPEDGVAYFPKGGGVLYSTTHPGRDSGSRE